METIPNLAIVVGICNLECFGFKQQNKKEKKKNQLCFPKTGEQRDISVDKAKEVLN